MAEKDQLSITIADGKITLQVGDLTAPMTPAAAYVASNALLDAVEMLEYEGPAADPESPCPCGDCETKTSLSDSEQEIFERLTTNLNTDVSRPITYTEMLANPLRIAVSEKGTVFNGTGAKAGLWVLKFAHRNKTDQQLFEMQYGHVYWKDEK